MRLTSNICVENLKLAEEKGKKEEKNAKKKTKKRDREMNKKNRSNHLNTVIKEKTLKNLVYKNKRKREQKVFSRKIFIGKTKTLEFVISFNLYFCKYLTSEYFSKNNSAEKATKFIIRI